LHSFQQLLELGPQVVLFLMLILMPVPSPFRPALSASQVELSIISGCGATSFEELQQVEALLQSISWLLVCLMMTLTLVLRRHAWSSSSLLLGSLFSPLSKQLPGPLS